MNNLIFPLLDKNHDWQQHLEKHREEAGELMDAIMNIRERGLEGILEEAMDTIQVSIGIIHKVDKENPALVREANIKHYLKMFTKGFEVCEILKLEGDHK